jgi:hypothetical protein
MEHRIVLETLKAKDSNKISWTIHRGSIGRVENEGRNRQIVFSHNGIEIVFALRKFRQSAIVRKELEFENIIRDRMVLPHFDGGLFSGQELLVIDERVGPEDFAGEIAEYACEFHILEYSERTSLTPPQLETIMEPLMSKCIENEYYELCSRLVRLAEEYRQAHQPLYQKKTFLALCKGYGWLLKFGKTDDVLDPVNLY